MNVRVTRISGHHRRRRRRSLHRKQQSSKIIHVRTRTSNSFGPSSDRSMNDHSNTRLARRSTRRNKHLIDQFQSQTGISTTFEEDHHRIRKRRIAKNNCSFRSFRVVPQQLTKKLSDDQFNSTNDHHRNGKRDTKKGCRTRQCFFISLFGIVLLLLIVIGVLLPVLLLKSKTSTIAPPQNVLLRWNTTGITIAGASGVAGIDSNPLNESYDAFKDYSYTLYAADAGNNRVQKYLMGVSNGITVDGQANGSAGSSANQLSGPASILVDANGNLYVADMWNNRVQLWADGASTGNTVAGNGSGFAGTSSSLLDYPLSIALDSSTGTLYIADSSNHRIISYESGVSSGVVVAGGNGPGLNNTQLWTPTGIYFDSLSNSVVITNFASNTVVRWIVGATSWTLLAGNIGGLSGNTSTLLFNPRDVTFDPMGNMYVLDRRNERIQLYMAGESVGTTIVGVTGISGNNSTLLNTPRSVKLDGQLNLYVADGHNHRIQKFVRY